MPDDANGALVRRFYDALTHGDLTAIEQLVTPDLAFNGQVIGSEGVKQHLAATRAAFPDLAWTIEELLTAGDRVVTRYTYGGTHRGPLMGIAPTGKPFRAAGIAIHRIRGDLIAEEWEVRDTF